MKNLYYFALLMLAILTLSFITYQSLYVESSSLFRAVKNNNIQEVEQILKNGFDPNIMEDKYETTLIQAIDSNYLDIVILLLDYGVDTNQTNSIGSTPLMRAIFSNNQHKFVPLLLLAGAKINELELNALDPAASKYAEEVIQYYLEVIKSLGLSDKAL
jgi:ankyrin repeat protein